MSLAFSSFLTAAQEQKSEPPIRFQVVDGTMPTPLTGQPGDPTRGRAIILDRNRGDCVVCHALPLPGRQFHGTVGPPLDGIGARAIAGALRLRLVDPKALNPQTPMPAYYQAEGLSHVLASFSGKTILTAQEIEDAVAYLLTLKDSPPERASESKSESALSLGSASYAVDGRRSGYTYLSEENQRLQNDDFANPGMLWVERGRELWRQLAGTSQQSCAQCHGDVAEKIRGVRTRYPQFDPRKKKLINLEQQINRCREERQLAPPYPYESEALLALTTFLGFQARGAPVNVNIDGPARPFFEAGRTFFLQRRGQLDLACTHCHDQQAGRRLRGEVVSQGQSNGFPIYRNLWQTLGSTHRMFAWCNTAVRAEPLPYGSDEYVNLELYVAWRGRDLSVETPAVRR